MNYNIWFFIEGRDVCHRVTISKDEDVARLKEAIHKQGNLRFWNGLEAAELVLLKVCDILIIAAVSTTPLF